MDPVVLPDAVTAVLVKFPVQTATAALVANESPYAITVTSGTTQKWLPAWTADVIPLDPGLGRQQLTITPKLITGVVTVPSAQVLVTLSLGGDAIPGTFPVALTRQVASYQPQTQLMSYSVLGGVTSDTRTTPVVPVGTHALLFSWSQIANVQTLRVVGTTTSARYADLVTSGTSYYVPVNSAYDTTFSILFTRTGGGPGATISIAAVLDTETVWVQNNQDGKVHVVVDAGGAAADPTISPTARLTIDESIGINADSVAAVAGIGGLTVRLFTVHLALLALPTQDARIYLRAGGADQFPAMGLREQGTSYDLRGLPLAVSQGFLLHNYGAAAQYVVGVITYSQA
jgi:hypothetical protein